MKRKILGKSNVIENSLYSDNVIKKFIKDKEQVVYGARSLKAQNSLFGRNTKDWDVLSKTPKKDADKLQKLLDKLVGYNYYYMTPAQHKGTWKVKTKGTDFIKNTKDDEGIADYSKLPKQLPFVVIEGIKYRTLKEELRAKRKSIGDKKFEFRHEKDRDDLNRAKEYLRVKRIVGSAH